MERFNRVHFTNAAYMTEVSRINIKFMCIPILHRPKTLNYLSYFKVMYIITYTLLLHTVSSISQPDYQSTWLELRSQSPTGNTLTVQHDLGETPLLVDVQIKSLDEPNKDFIFPAVGKPNKSNLV